MKRTVEYSTDKGKKKSYVYDDEYPCIICGEPVISASMGGTVICPWCDTGHCRYCGMTTMVLREEIDGGRSKKELLDHMKWHREKEPDRNRALLEVHRKIEKVSRDGFKKFVEDVMKSNGDDSKKIFEDARGMEFEVGDGGWEHPKTEGSMQYDCQFTETKDSINCHGVSCNDCRLLFEK